VTETELPETETKNGLETLTSLVCRVLLYKPAASSRQFGYKKP